MGTGKRTMNASTAGRIVIYFMVTLIVLAMVLPFIHELAKSFSFPTEVNSGRVALWPRQFTFGNYFYYYRKHLVPLLRSFGVTIYITVVGTVWSVLISSLTAFPISRSRREFRFGPVIMWFAIFAIVFTPPMVPYFLAIKSYGLLDSVWAIILPHTVIPYHLVLLVAFFRELPEAIFDSCRIDGASDFRIYWQIVLPLSKAVLATVIIFTAIMLWNIFLHPLLFIRNPNKMPLQIFLNSIFQGGGDANPAESMIRIDPFAESQSIKSALVVLVILPVVTVYPLLQKHFIKGLMLGAVKE